MKFLTISILFASLLSAQKINLGTQATGTLKGAQFPALTGPVTTVAGSLATSITASGVSVGACGDTTHFPIPTFGADGRATGCTTQSVSTGTVPVSAGGTGATTLTGILQGNGTSAFTANVAANPLQYLRRAVGVSPTSYEFATNATFYAADYQWSQTPGGSISIGGVSLTLTPGPIGVAAGAYLYVSAGTGTAEAVLITGGTCVAAGASSCTVQFTAANTHTGAWTIGSATAGIQEAILATGGSKSKVQIPAGSSTSYAKIIVPYCLNVVGYGMQSSTIIMATGFVTRAIEVLTPTGACVSLSDFTLSYTSHGTSQEGLYLEDLSDGQISRLAIVNSFRGITGRSIARVHFTNLNIFPYDDCYHINSNGASAVTTVSVPEIHGGYCTMQSGAGSVISLGATIAGMIIDGLNSGLGINGISASCSSGAINEVLVVNSIFDSYSTAGLNMILSGSCTASRWKIANNLFADATGGQFGLLLQGGSAGTITGLTITGNTILTDSATAIGIDLQGVKGALIAGNIVNGNQTGGDAVLLDAIANTVIQISGNQLGLSSTYGVTSGAEYGVFLSAHAHNDINITGNTLVGSTAAISNASTVANGVLWTNNKGIDNVAGVVASAGTMAVPINSYFTITGTTGVTAVSGLFTGRTGTIVTTSGAVAFTAGATIGNSCTTTQNKPYNFVFDGTKVWLNGAGC